MDICIHRWAYANPRGHMHTCTGEYDQSKPPGKDEDGKDLPPLTPKEKARTARMLFVNRVQRFQEV